MMALAPAAAALLYLVLNEHAPRLASAIPEIEATGPQARPSETIVTSSVIAPESANDTPPDPSTAVYVPATLPGAFTLRTL